MTVRTPVGFYEQHRGEVHVAFEGQEARKVAHDFVAEFKSLKIHAVSCGVKSEMEALKRTVFEHDYRTVELEFRIGLHGKNDVGETRWAKLRAFLGNETGRSITVEKITRGGEPGTTSRYVEGLGVPRWNHKKRVHAEDDHEPRPWRIRTAVSLEHVEPAPSPPSAWSIQRTKERYSYVVGPWTIDLTKVATSPPTDIDADHSYEVEVELTDHLEFFGKELKDIVAAGRTIANDMIAHMNG